MMDIKTIVMEIAEIKLTIETSVPNIADRLKASYWCSSAREHSDMSLVVTRSNILPPDVYPYPDLISDGDILKFQAESCFGKIDLHQKKAELLITDVRPVEDTDYFIRILIALLCFQQGGLLVHGAGIVKNGFAYIFFGHSGSGKTTVSILTPDGITLSDDLVVVKPYRQLWKVYATPFGRIVTDDQVQVGYPLRSMYRLVKDKSNYLEELSHSIAVADLIASAPVISNTSSYITQVLQRCETLVSNIPIYRLHFLPDNSFWNLIS